MTLSTLLLGCVPCRGEIATSEPEAWAAPVLQCAERRDVRPIAVDDRCNASSTIARLGGEVVVAPGPEGAHLVWVRGEAGGPLALVELDGKAAELHAIGWLRASATEIRMEMVGDWLVVHDESSVQLVHRDRDELRELVLARPGMDCSVPARFAIREQGHRSIDDYLEREFVIERSLVFIEDQPVIREHLVVRDLDPRVGAEPETIVREAELDRPLALDGHVLRVSTGLWEEVVEDETEIVIEAPSIGSRGRQ